MGQITFRRRKLGGEQCQSRSWTHIGIRPKSHDVRRIYHDETIKKKFINDKFAKISRIAVNLLGPPGRMLYRSKSMKKPTTIFNANIYNSKAKKIWYGDLEIVRDREVLIELSRRLGPIYILWEIDGMFLKNNPVLDYVKSVAIVIVKNRNIQYSNQFDEYVKYWQSLERKKK